MAQQQETPIHWDQHASRWNLTLIFGLVVVILGVLFPANLLLVPLGLLMAAYSWLTTPRQYLLYRDRMMVAYGMPRTRVIPFAEISHVEILALPFGERLRLRMVSGRPMMLMMRDPGAFRNHLEDALAQYHGEQSGDFRMERYGSALDAPAAGEVDDTGAAAERETAPANDAPAADAPAEPEREPSARPGGYEPSPTSGSYTEPPAPDYSGEGRPAYGADVDVDAGRPGDEDQRNRPPSPY